MAAFLARCEEDMYKELRSYEAQMIALRTKLTSDADVFVFVGRVFFLSAPPKATSSTPPALPDCMPATQAVLQRLSGLIGKRGYSLAVGAAYGAHLLGDAIFTASAP